jgi:hypothetical protein
MNRDELLHRWRNALHGITLTVECLARLEPNASPEEIQKARRLDALAWQQLTEAHAETVKQILKGLGL